MQSVISVKDIKKCYGTNTVLNGLNFEVKRGSIFALLGENGAGKTTTVRILTTLIQADRGVAKIAGYDTKHEADAVKHIISLTGQYAAVDELLTGEENLMMMGRLYHLDLKTARRRTAELLEQFDLVEAARKPVKSYSGGMRRKLDIAISLLSKPKVIFLDEPTTGLDPRSRKHMWNLIKQLSDTGVTIFLTTQYLEEADQLADTIAIIDGGRIVEEGTAEQLKRMIGEEKLEFRFDDHDTLQTAQTIVQGYVDKQEKVISVTAGSTGDLRTLLNRLYEMNIEPESIQLRKPTLDDVFVEITNRKQKEGVAG